MTARLHYATTWRSRRQLLEEQFGANFLAQVLHPAVVVFVNLAVFFIQIYTTLVHDTVFRRGV
jgi:hypothetical protein